MSYWMAVRRRLMAIALAGIDVAALAIAYTGAMTDQIVTMGDGNQYRLLTLTSSGTLAVEKPVVADVWMCGGGAAGESGSRNGGGRGGSGGFITQAVQQKISNIIAVVGAGNSGASSVSGDISLAANGAMATIPYGYTGAAGASGGGGGADRYTDGLGGAGVTTHPFGDTTYFSGKPHCPGGGGGAWRDESNENFNEYATGGKGGSNGSSGGQAQTGSRYNDANAAPGGLFGGGNGCGDPALSGSRAKSGYFYGAGGGGGAGSDYISSYPGEAYFTYGGAGYQGVIYVRIPLNQPKPESASDFQMVEYIGASGTQYINTGLSLDKGFRAVMKVKVTQSLNRIQGLIGSHEEASPYYRNYFAINPNMSSWNLGAYAAFTFGTCALNTVYEIDVSNISEAFFCKINGVAQTMAGTPGSAARSSRPLYLLAMNYPSDLLPACANLYYCKIYNPSGELVGDLVPCYRKSDNEPGVWDKVGKRFLPNSGTGTFTVGANV